MVGSVELLDADNFSRLAMSPAGFKLQPTVSTCTYQSWFLFLVLMEEETKAVIPGCFPCQSLLLCCNHPQPETGREADAFGAL